MSHVFISYSHKDCDFAENLKSRIEKEGFDVWTDESKLVAGEDWRSGIDEAIKDALVLIVIMTPSAKSSEYVTYEWAFAWGIGVKIIPVLLEPTILHPRLETLQYFDFTNRAGRPWAGLITLLKKVGTSPAPRPSTRPRGIPTIIQNAMDMLDNVDEAIRGKAVLILEKSNHPVALQSLINGLKHPLLDVRVNVAEALGRIKDPTAVPALSETLCDNEWDVCANAARALGEIKDPAAVPILVEMLRGNNVSGRWAATAAAYALGKIKDPAAAPALREALRDSDSDVRRAAAYALGKIKDPAAAPALREALRDSDSDVRQAAAQALGEIKDPAAVPALREALRDGDSDVRRAAVRAFGKIEGPAAVAALGLGEPQGRRIVLSSTFRTAEQEFLPKNQQ